MAGSREGEAYPPPLDDVRLVVLAGDHGVAGHGVSAYPASVTGAMVRTMVSGRAGVRALATAHGVRVRVLDVAVDADLSDLPAEQSLALGRELAGEEVADDAQVLMTGDLGIGNTTPAAALVAALLDLPAEEVIGRGTGVDDAGWARKCDVVALALRRAGRVTDPVRALTALGSADLAATTGFLVAAAEARTPVVLDGVASLTCALLAERFAPGASAWWVAGHRSTEPAQALALSALGLEPVLDLGMRLGEGSGAVLAVPVLRSAVAVLRGTALLADVMPA